MVPGGRKVQVIMVCTPRIPEQEIVSAPEPQQRIAMRASGVLILVKRIDKFPLVLIYRLGQRNVLIRRS